MTGLVSVVIPNHNYAAYVGDAVRSVHAQRDASVEVVVVDNGSTDDSLDVLRQFGDTIRVVVQSNLGQSGARNAGVLAARGEFVAFLDADDSWLPTKLERCLAAFDRDPTIDFVCHDETVSRDGAVLRTARYGRALDGLYERLLFEGNAVSTSAVVVRRAKLAEVGGFREDPRFDTVEDYDLWMRLAKVSRFHFLHEVLGDYRLAEGSASSRAKYHHDNLVSLLSDHFAALPVRSPLRERARLASVSRATARALLERGDAAGALGYARDAAMTWPFHWKNPATVALCAIKRLA